MIIPEQRCGLRNSGKRVQQESEQLPGGVRAGLGSLEEVAGQARFAWGEGLGALQGGVEKLEVDVSLLSLGNSFYRTSVQGLGGGGCWGGE